MELRLDDKTAIVTGGSRGIGKAIAAAYAAAGAQVVLCARNAASLEEAAGEIGHGCDWLVANAGRPDEAAATVDTVIERYGRVDILVNNAAASPYAGRMIDVDLGAWDKTIQVNVTGPLVWAQQCWIRSMEAHGGVIVNISSVGALKTSPVIGVYDLTKSALLYLTEQLAAELGPAVRVNAILPGLVRTEFSRILWDGPHGVDYERLLPVRRLGEPSDIAGMAVLLASEHGSWITGQCIVVDGGSLVAVDPDAVI